MLTSRQSVGAFLCGLALALAGLGLRAQSSSQTPTDPLAVPRISQADFKALLATGDAYVVDVRSAVTYAAGHIPGAVSVPYDEMLDRADDVLERAGKRAVVTYCSCPSEHTAAEAGLILMARGGKDVRALQGGYIDWVRGGGVVERRLTGGGSLGR